MTNKSTPRHFAAAALDKIGTAIMAVGILLTLPGIFLSEFGVQCERIAQRIRYPDDSLDGHPKKGFDAMTRPYQSAGKSDVSNGVRKG